MFEKPYASYPLSTLISKQLGGGTPPRQVPSYWSGGIPWASVKDFPEQAAVITDTQEHISVQGLNASASNLIPAGTPLVCTRMAVGRTAMASVAMAINQDVKALVPAARVPAAYLLKLLQLVQPIAEARAVGSTVKGIRVQDYLGLMVPVADPSSQPIIAAVLDTLDTAIQETEAIIAKLKAVKQGLLHDLLTRGIDDNGELRPPRSASPDLYQHTSIGWVPQGWEVKPLSNLLARVDPAMRSGPFGSALLKHELVPAGYPLLGIDNVFTERFVAEYTRFVTRSKYQQLQRYAVRPSDLMITIMGTVGRCCLVPDDIDAALSSKHTWTITLDRSLYSPYLAMLQINYSPWVLNHFSRDQQGGTMSAIRSETIRSTPLPVPPLGEQRLMEERLREVSRRIDLEGVQMAKQRQQKAGLMDDLLTGRVRVTPLLEPAAA